MLLLGPHQVKLFLSLGGALWAVAVACGVLSVTHSGGWGDTVRGPALLFLEFWAIARCFEALSHTDESFERLLVESNRSAGAIGCGSVPVTKSLTAAKSGGHQEWCPPLSIADLYPVGRGGCFVGNCSLRWRPCQSSGLKVARKSHSRAESGRSDSELTCTRRPYQ